ncbi:hypothetical protein A2U01_0065152, partial [Trifolium medium]|nr:hypothetical protein [Trifolium medium]
YSGCNSPTSLSTGLLPIISVDVAEPNRFPNQFGLLNRFRLNRVEVNWIQWMKQLQQH